MSIQSQKRLEEELEAGRRRLIERHGFNPDGEQPVETPINPVSPVPPEEEVAINITGIGNYEAGARVSHTIISDAPLAPAEVIAAVSEPVAVAGELPAIEPLPEPASRIYTNDELVAIAKEDGLKGLREIATPLGVVGRGKDELVREIQIAQGTWVEPVAEAAPPAPPAPEEVTEQVTEEAPASVSIDDDIDALLKD